MFSVPRETGGIEVSGCLFKQLLALANQAKGAEREGLQIRARAQERTGLLLRALDVA